MKKLRKVIALLILAAVTFTSAGNDIADPDESELARLKAENEALEKELGVLQLELEQGTVSLGEPDYELPFDLGGGDESDELLEKSLQELMELQVGAASLTKTTKRLTPSTVTTITREDIQHSGARSLIELLEIYVPNFQWIFHGAKPRHLGLRGINGKDDKYLLLVNGRRMNEKTDFGVFSERDLPLLRDIREIQVVRGPGSALYGAGALSMVINLLIDTPETFEGFEASGRIGAFYEEFYSSEFKWGKKFSDDKGLLIYGGGSIYPGADETKSPLRLTCDSPGAYKGGGDYFPNDYYSESLGMKNYNEAYRGLPRVKFHAHYMHGNWDFWLRYTQGGEYMDQIEYTPTEGNPPLPQRDIEYGQGYRQATGAAEYEQKFSDKFKLQYHFSYSQTHIDTVPYSYCREMMYREDRYVGRLLANWDVHEDHLLAFGGEWTHDEYGLDPMGHSNTFNYVLGNIQESPRWHGDMISAIGEWQWHFSENLTSFVSVRRDDHSMVDKMYSPRVSFIYTPSKKDTIKLMLSRATRTDAAENIRINDATNKSPNTKYEKLHAYELRYERQHDKNLWFAVSGFKHTHDMVSYSSSLGKTGPVGNFKTTGIEVEGKYKKDKLEVIASHAYTKLDHASLGDGISEVEDTAAPMGFGTNWANWANHQSKIHINYELAPKWLLTNNLVILWGYPGGRDYAKYVTRFSWRWRRWNPNADEAFVKASYFWNAGLEHKYNDNLTFRFDAYNILGWFDKDLGKRRSGFNNDFLGQYRVQPTAFGLQIIYKF